MAEAGERIEFTVSEPVPTVAKLAAKATPVRSSIPMSASNFFSLKP